MKRARPNDDAEVLSSTKLPRKEKEKLKECKLYDEIISSVCETSFDQKSYNMSSFYEDEVVGQLVRHYSNACYGGD